LLVRFLENFYFFFVFWVLKSVYLIFSVLWNARENNFDVFFLFDDALI